MSVGNQNKCQICTNNTMTTAHNTPMNLRYLMKDISEALQLDRTEKNEDAYRKYLECVLRITTTLLRTLHSDGGHVKTTADVKKMVRLGQQSMDRIAIIINDSYDRNASKTTSTAQGPPHVTSPSQLRSPISSVVSPVTPMTPVTPSGRLKAGGTLDSTITRQKKLSPMELARRQNEQLLYAFQARQTCVHKGKNRSASVNLSLTLQRKMAENLAIGKAQQAVLAKKMNERQLRLEEQASRRFHAPLGMSKEEQNQRLVYKKVLEFEQEEFWMIDLRNKFEGNPKDIDVISHLITTILRCESHPLTNQLKQYQNKMIEKVYHLVEGHAEGVEKTKVPLSKETLNRFKQFSISLKSKSVNTNSLVDKCKTDSSDKNQSKAVKENSDNFVTKLDANEQSKNCPIESDEIKIDDKELTSKTNWNTAIVKSNQTVQSELQTALKHGDQLTKKLETENKRLQVLTRQSTEEYDKYNQDNMDYLFDANDSEDDNCNEEDTIDDRETRDHELDIKTDMETAKDKDLTTTGSILDENKKSNNEKGYETSKTLRKVPSYGNFKDEITELWNEAYHRHLKTITEDILIHIERIQVLFVIAYAELDSPEGQDQCNVLLETFYFKPIWEHLLILFRLANETKEIAIASIMTEKQNCCPADFNVRQELCLTQSIDQHSKHLGDQDVCQSHDQDIQSHDQGSLPYEEAVGELISITSCPTMLDKLECLVRTSRLVLQCLDEHYKTTQPPSIGADDLLPVLCYIVTRCRLPQIVSECHAMDVFIHEGYMFGEEGYCLTSFQTAINYLITQGMQP